MSKFIEAQRNLLIILSSFGIFSFDLHTYKRTYRKWIYCYLFNLMLHSEFMYVTLNYISTFTEFLHDYTTTTKTVHIVEFSGNLITKITIAISTLFRSGGQIELLQKLEKIENQIEKLKVSSNLNEFFESLRLKSNVILITSIIFHAIMFFT